MNPELFRYIKFANDDRRREARWLVVSKITALGAAFFAGLAFGLMVAKCWG